ncbi:MAG: hypothetical protein IKR07_02520 [Oscillospiraceae bacterium]|nr:hypothetical protein [Oscillospiraceae bacterium]
MRNTKKKLRGVLLQLPQEKPVNEFAGCVGLVHSRLDDGLRETPEEISLPAGSIIPASIESCIRDEKQKPHRIYKGGATWTRKRCAV